MLKRTFKPGYKSLDPGVQTKVRDEIMDKCFWHKPEQSFKGLNIFYRKMRGDTRISGLEAREIERVFEKYNINPWTGKKLRKNEKDLG